jgi:hypothetical protein
MRVGDLVCLDSYNEIGIILTVFESPKSNAVFLRPDDIIDIMHPYLVHFTSGYSDWFAERSLNIVSKGQTNESR